MPTPKLSSSPSTTHHSATVMSPTRLAPSRGDDYSSRRAGRGSLPWSLTSNTRSRQLQPQDGAVPSTSKLTSIAGRFLGGLPHEPEDARLTGGTRSLARRLLGLNILSSARKAPHTTELKKGSPVIGSPAIQVA